jgi:uncharacterized membrane protein YhaH (DUF805 family)
MTGPTGPDQNYPQGGAPQGQPGYGQAPGYGPPPAYGQTPGYGQAPGYAPAPAYGGPGFQPASMGFPDAVRSALTQYVGFSGRARRSEYWWFALFNVILSFVASLLDAAIGASIFGLIVGLGLLLPSRAVGVRRLHDINRSGWWLLLGLIPLVGAIILIVWFCQDSDRGPNQYGDSPKYPAAY